MGFAYGKAASLNEVTPTRGNNANGSKAVTATGIASVAHQTAIKTTIAATDQPIAFNPDGAGKSSINTNRINPTKKPFF